MWFMLPLFTAEIPFLAYCQINEPLIILNLPNLAWRFQE